MTGLDPTVLWCSSAETSASSRDQSWLGDTPLLHIAHPKVRTTALKLTGRFNTRREQAVAVHNFVQDMPFGTSADSVGTTPMDVLKRKMGDCHCKSTLMVALLRAIGIPARMRFVTLKPDFLYGILDLGELPVEHAITEVWLDGRWVSTDSYVVDMKLAGAARRRLEREHRALGYGLHVNGASSWDGSGDAYAQFVPGDPNSQPIHDWGTFDDPYQFYSQVPEVKNRLSFGSRMKWSIAASLVNRRVQAVRSGAG